LILQLVRIVTSKSAHGNRLSLRVRVRVRVGVSVNTFSIKYSSSLRYKYFYSLEFTAPNIVGNIDEKWCN